MRANLTIGPLLFHWPAERKRDFYFRIADEAPVDTVYLGSEEHTSELQSRGLNSYAVFSLKKKKTPLRRTLNKGNNTGKSILRWKDSTHKMFIG